MKLFVYGIFLGERMREMYGMTDPQYATVKDFATFGDHIVTAAYIPNSRLALTGLVVTPDPDKWEQLDRLEGGYDRIVVTTTDGEQCYMYAKQGTAKEIGYERGQKANNHTSDRVR